MTRTKVWLIAVLALALAAPALATDDEETKVRRIEVKKVVECTDGEDCEEQVNRVVFISDNGDVRVLEGEDVEWVSEDEVHVLKANGHVVLTEDVRGDEGVAESVRRRAHRVMKRLGRDGSRLHRRHGGGAFLGVQLSELTPELRTHFGVPEDAGVMVGKVVDDSPALRAGLEVGDIVTAVGETPVASASALGRAIRRNEDGDTVVLEVWRDGQVQKIEATLEDRQREVAMGAGSSVHPRLLRHLPPDVRRQAAVEPWPHRGASAVIGEPGSLVSIEAVCEDGEDCLVDFDGTDWSFAFSSDRDANSITASACGDLDDCEVNVDCTGGDCACTVNGETVDCSIFPGLSP